MKTRKGITDFVCFKIFLGCAFDLQTQVLHDKTVQSDNLDLVTEELVELSQRMSPKSAVKNPEIAAIVDLSLPKDPISTCSILRYGEYNKSTCKCQAIFLTLIIFSLILDPIILYGDD